MPESGVYIFLYRTSRRRHAPNLEVTCRAGLQAPKSKTLPLLTPVHLFVPPTDRSLCSDSHCFRMLCTATRTSRLLFTRPHLRGSSRVSCDERDGSESSPMISTYSLKPSSSNLPLISIAAPRHSRSSSSRHRSWENAPDSNTTNVCLRASYTPIPQAGFQLYLQGPHPNDNATLTRTFSLY